MIIPCLVIKSYKILNFIISQFQMQAILLGEIILINLVHGTYQLRPQTEPQ